MFMGDKLEMKNQKGFSLVELLVVVIIIAIIAAIAIPALLSSRRAANEASAISSLRTIHSAEATYFGTTGNNADYATIANLGAGGLIDVTLAAGAKSGYNFAGSIGAAGSGIYCATAVATTQGSTGVRGFAVSQNGVIYANPDNTGVVASCAAGVLTPVGTPIQ